MDNEQKVIVACPKCGQKLKCVLGGAGTCPKCGTRVVFPEHMSQADPALNKEFFLSLSRVKPINMKKDRKNRERHPSRAAFLKKLSSVFSSLQLSAVAFLLD